ncbi:MAG: GntR family transcriptional regulator [Silicimonas sp.]
MKSDTVFKRAHNNLLDVLSSLHTGEKLPSETELGRRLGVSRTTVRKIIHVLQERGAITGNGRNRTVGRVGDTIRRFPISETVSMSEQVEAMFMEWMLKDDTRPGTAINELELARQFGVATSGIREFLNRFQRFGLIEHRAHGGWVFKGFTRAFALELFEIREMFELRSAQAFGRQPDTSPVWDALQKIRERHVQILDDIDHSFHDFSELDSAFHRFVHSASPNRFIDGFSDINALIFHYHYQWNKKDERQRNEVAINEHLTYIDALFTRNPSIIELACRAHLTSARQTLLNSTMD